MANAFQHKYYSLRREVRLRYIVFAQTLGKYRTRYEQWRCLHLYRPARIGNKLGRFCPLCEKSEVMPREIFYAYFGEIDGANY